MAKEKERKYSVSYYLKDSKLSKPLQDMMKDLYKGLTKTLGEWEEVDKSTNQGRC